LIKKIKSKVTIILEAKFHRRNGNNHSNCNNKNGKIDEELAITYYLNALNEIRSFAENIKAKLIEIPEENPYHVIKYIGGLESFAYGEYRKLSILKKDFEAYFSLKGYTHFGEIEVFAYGNSNLIKKLKTPVDAVAPVSKERLCQFIEKEANVYIFKKVHYNLNKMHPKNIKKFFEIVSSKEHRKSSKIGHRINELMLEI